MDNYYEARKYRKRIAPFNDKKSDIKIDLISDAEEIFRKYMKSFVKRRKSKNDVIMDYCRLNIRLIDKKPRRILKAKGIKCPPDYEKKLDYLEECIVHGENLIPFMSKNIQYLTREDMLLYDWGIYHFHISDEKEENSFFMKRSDYLLMTYIEGDFIYFLDIVPHSSTDIVIWSDTKYLDIIRENWPNLMDKYVIKDCVPVESYNDTEISKIRKRGALIISKWDNRNALFSPGGGYASDRTSIRAMQQRDYLIDLISEIEPIWIENFSEDVLNVIHQVLHLENIDYLDIKMIGFSEKSCTFLEQQTKLLFFLDEKELQWNMICVSITK